MKLLFTNGIIGEINDNKIRLKAANAFLQTEYPYNAESIKIMEDEFRIRLIGEDYSQKSISPFEVFDFVVYDNGLLRNIKMEMYRLNIQINELYVLIYDEIFKDNSSEELNKIKLLSPMFLSTGGLAHNSFMSKEEFQKSLYDSPQIKIFNSETIKKLVYLYDLQSMIDDVKNSFYSIENSFIHSSNVLHEIINNAPKIFIKSEKINKYEYFLQGPQVEILSAHFMSTIVRICSTLDILTKFTYEITNIPEEYKNFIKFKSGGIYFRNIGRFVDVFKELDNYKGSIIDKREDFQQIILVRNTIIHNSFLSINPGITIGYGTPEINNQKLTYGKFYIWDVDEDGKATRWVNRSRFYSQSRCIQEYLLNEIIQFYDAFSKTIELFKEYLNNASL